MTEVGHRRDKYQYGQASIVDKSTENKLKDERCTHIDQLLCEWFTVPMDEALEIISCIAGGYDLIKR